MSLQHRQSSEADFLTSGKRGPRYGNAHGQWSTHPCKARGKSHKFSCTRCLVRRNVSGQADSQLWQVADARWHTKTPQEICFYCRLHSQIFLSMLFFFTKHFREQRGAPLEMGVMGENVAMIFQNEVTDRSCQLFFSF